MISFEILINDLEPFSEYDRDRFEKMIFDNVDAVSKPNTKNGAANIDGNWIPKSQLRVDVDDNIWISKWMIDKLNENE